MPKKHENPKPGRGDKVLMGQERNEFLTRALDSLPKKNKQVLSMFFFKQKPIEQIAEELKEDPKIIANRISEGYEKLKNGPHAEILKELL